MKCLECGKEMESGFISVGSDLAWSEKPTWLSRFKGTTLVFTMGIAYLPGFKCDHYHLLIAKYVPGAFSRDDLPNNSEQKDSLNVNLNKNNANSKMKIKRDEVL